MNTLALTRKDDMMKSVEQEKEPIKKILTHGLQTGLITESEMEAALSMTTWAEIQPILDKAQNIKDNKDDLKLARAEHPLHRSNFTEDELKKLRSLAPEEYDLLK